jgi:Domain of unknown function (DUF4386)
MNSYRKISTVAGLLFILGIVAGLLSVVPVVDDPDYLTEISQNEGQLLTGALFQFVMAVIYVCLAITLYPLLRRYSEGLALGFVSFRSVAAVFHIVGVISLILLLTFSQEFLKVGSPEVSHFQTLGALLQSARDFTNHVAMILSLSIGGIMFYLVLFKSKLVPRWLSGWGFVGTILTIVASLILMFNLVEIVSTTYLVLNIPMALNEMFLAVWLIVKGFDRKAIASLTTQKRG